jgi:hypothetical protein
VAVAVLVLAVGLLAWYVIRPLVQPPAGCTVTLAGNGGQDDVQAYPLTTEQADNAATIAGVGAKLGMPEHAVTVAIATALQESGLRNLPEGDRDSVGLFQQRPSQGWGTEAQLTDPVYAATAFYQRLRQQPNWTRLAVTDAAQLVQRSATPRAYARWEPKANATAAALTGVATASLTCHDLKLGPASDVLFTLARRELGNAALTGTHPPDRERALARWLVAHATRLAIDRVTANGRTWTASSGDWTQTGPPDGRLSLHQVAPSG